jgi:carnitine 3-dehydrogenase
VLAREEELAHKKARRWKKGAKIAGALSLCQSVVQTSWVDYNGHMSDAYYLLAFGDGLDAFFRYIGDDDAYRATGHTFFTAETHLNYYREMKAGEPFVIETQVVGCDEKRMHLFHRMLHGRTKDVVATNEIIQLHVDQKAGKVVPMRADLYEALSAVSAAHSKLKKPAELGRVMEVRKPEGARSARHGRRDAAARSRRR